MLAGDLGKALADGDDFLATAPLDDDSTRLHLSQGRGPHDDAQEGRRLVAAPTDWFEDAEGSTYDDASVPLRREVGPRTVVRTERIVDLSAADEDAWMASALSTGASCDGSGLQTV